MTKKNGPNDRTLQSSGKNTTKRGRDTQPIKTLVKTLVIKTLTELVEFVRKLDEKMKRNVQTTNREGKETGTQVDSEQKVEINIQQEQNEETRIQKNEERLRSLQDIFKCSNI